MVQHRPERPTPEVTVGHTQDETASPTLPPIPNTLLLVISGMKSQILDISGMALARLGRGVQEKGSPRTKLPPSPSLCSSCPDRHCEILSPFKGMCLSCGDSSFLEPWPLSGHAVLLLSHSPAPTCGVSALLFPCWVKQEARPVVLTE